MKKFKRILSLTLTAVMLFTLAISLTVTAEPATYKTEAIDVSFVKTNWTLEDVPEMLELYSLTYDESSGSTVYTRTLIEDNAGVTFSSSNPDVIEVSENGTVTPKKLGYSIVTITYNGVSRKVMLFSQESYRNTYITPDGVIIGDNDYKKGATVNDPFALPFKETITDEDQGDVTEVEVYKQVWQNTTESDLDVYPGRPSLLNIWFYDDGSDIPQTKVCFGDFDIEQRQIIANTIYYRNLLGGWTDEQLIDRTGMGWHQATVLVTNDAAEEGKYKWTFYLDGDVHCIKEYASTGSNVIRIPVNQYAKDLYVGEYNQEFNVEQKITDYDSLENISTQVKPTLFFTNNLEIGETDINTLIDIKDASGNAVPFNATLDNARVHIDFANELNANTSYTITLSENIKDVYGNSLPEASRAITFKTANNKVSDIVGNKYILLSEKRIDMSAVSNKAEGTTANELVANTAGTYTVSLKTGYTDDELRSVDKYIIKYKYYVDNFDFLSDFGRIYMTASDGTTRYLTSPSIAGSKASYDIQFRFPISYLNASGEIESNWNNTIFRGDDFAKFEGEYCEVTHEISVNRNSSERTGATTKMTFVGKDGTTVTSAESFPIHDGYVFKDLNMMDFSLKSSETFKVKDMTVYMMQKKVTDVDFALTEVTWDDETPVENITDLKGNTTIFNYTVTNNKLTAGTDKYIVTIAVYDTQTNKIVAVNNSGLLTVGEKATPVPGSIEINVPHDAPDTLAVYAYIWDGYASMKPLADKADLFAE